MVVGFLVHVTPSNFFSRVLRNEGLVYKSYFFSEQPFYGNYSKLDSHKNTVISRVSRWRQKPWQGLFPIIRYIFPRAWYFYIYIWQLANKAKYYMKNSADRGGCLSCTKAQMHINSRIWKRSKSYMEIPASTAQEYKKWHGSHLGKVFIFAG